MVEAFEVGVDSGVDGYLTSWEDLPLASSSSGKAYYITEYNNAIAYSDGVRWKIDRPVKIYSNSPIDTVSGVTGLTAFRSVKVPGGLLGKNGLIRIDPIFKYSANANAKNAGYRVSQTDNILDGVQMWQHSQQSVSTSSLPLLLSNDNSEVAQVAATAGATNGSVGQSTAATEVTASVDTTQDWYITLTISPVNSGDTCILRRLVVTVEPCYN